MSSFLNGIGNISRSITDLLGSTLLSSQEVGDSYNIAHKSLTTLGAMLGGYLIYRAINWAKNKYDVHNAVTQNTHYAEHDDEEAEIFHDVEDADEAAEIFHDVEDYDRLANIVFRIGKPQSWSLKTNLAG